MARATIPVGKNAVYGGSAMIARNGDSPSEKFTPKKFAVIRPAEQHAKLALPVLPCRQKGMR